MLTRYFLNLQIKMNLELTKKINFFKESDPVKLIISETPHSANNPKLVLNGFLYSVTKKEAVYEILISIGGLQLKIETSNEFEELKTKKDLVLSFFYE